MNWILVGLALFYTLHLLPATKPRFRRTLIKFKGPAAYAITYTIAMIGSIVLMVYGWRSSQQWSVYLPPEWGFAPGITLALTGALLFGFGAVRTMKSNLKRLIRHPQLIGLLFWSTGHLLLNGDNLSLMLFGGLSVWALIMRFLINRRDGVWQKPDKVPLSTEIPPVMTALLMVTIFLYAHPWLSGIKILNL